MEELKQNEQIQTPKTKKTDEFHLKQITICLLYTAIQAYAVKDGALKPFSLHMDALTDDEREIILKGCLINYYRG